MKRLCLIIVCAGMFCSQSSVCGAKYEVFEDFTPVVTASAPKLVQSLKPIAPASVPRKDIQDFLGKNPKFHAFLQSAPLDKLVRLSAAVSQAGPQHLSSGQAPLKAEEFLIKIATIQAALQATVRLELAKRAKKDDEPVLESQEDESVTDAKKTFVLMQAALNDAVIKRKAVLPTQEQS